MGPSMSFFFFFLLSGHDMSIKLSLGNSVYTCGLLLLSGLVRKAALCSWKQKLQRLISVQMSDSQVHSQSGDGRRSHVYTSAQETL